LIREEAIKLGKAASKALDEWKPNGKICSKNGEKCYPVHWQSEDNGSLNAVIKDGTTYSKCGIDEHNKRFCEVNGERLYEP
jgi:hypothetical protein